jgi:hypothetical protein
VLGDWSASYPATSLKLAPIVLVVVLVLGPTISFFSNLHAFIPVGGPRLLFRGLQGREQPESGKASHRGHGGHKEKVLGRSFIL